ncbi:hypothetical protein EAV90_28825 [Bradyrhizobium vignae]|nr:hypothetical protein EAV90_28825 [Bradyrhizobium vignae]
MSENSFKAIVKMQGIGHGIRFASASIRSERTTALSSSLRAKRSNPESLGGKILDCFAALAMTECVAAGEAMPRVASAWPKRRRVSYSSLPRVMAMDASVLVRVHSMLSRR